MSQQFFLAHNFISTLLEIQIMAVIANFIFIFLTAYKAGYNDYNKLQPIVDLSYNKIVMINVLLAL